MNNEKNCYLGIDGKKVGPLSEAEIRKLHKGGKLGGGYKIYKDGHERLD